MIIRARFRGISGRRILTGAGVFIIDREAEIIELPAPGEEVFLFVNPGGFLRAMVRAKDVLLEENIEEMKGEAERKSELARMQRAVQRSMEELQEAQAKEGEYRAAAAYGLEIVKDILQRLESHLGEPS